MVVRQGQGGKGARDKGEAVKEVEEAACNEDMSATGERSSGLYVKKVEGKWVV